ncbi:MAG: hypothetical protein EOO07_34195 [Chitinophagaceae bacterium]|nr:MAG: hypothetical protein EOO07_34195 [Chitinophagaceae bacterium]
MNVKQILVDILVLAAGIFTALIAIYYVLKNDIHQYLNSKIATTPNEERAQLLPVRVQAHERLLIFVDRISPANLLIRLHQQGIDLQTLQAGILNEIKSEYQHNITQQLYVSSTTWNVVRKLKDDTLAMITNAVKGMPKEASGVELSKSILQHMATISEDPYQLTIELIKKDMQLLF